METESKSGASTTPPVTPPSLTYVIDRPLTLKRGPHKETFYVSATVYADAAERGPYWELEGDIDVSLDPEGIPLTPWLDRDVVRDLETALLESLPPPSMERVMM